MRQFRAVRAIISASALTLGVAPLVASTSYAATEAGSGNGASGASFAQSFGLAGNAYLPDANTLRLTDASGGEAGAAWADAPVNTANDLDVRFTFHLHDSNTSPQADGITFALQSSSGGAAALGGNGEGLGYAGITPSYAVEFDTYQNGFDGDANHIGILQGGDVANYVVAPVTPPFALYGQPITAWIEYSSASHELAVYAGTGSSKPTTPFVIADVDLSSLSGNPVYMGFTGSTGSDDEVQDITAFSQGPTGIDVPATANPWGAGLSTPPAPGGGSGGTLPVEVPIPSSARRFEFSASGSIVSGTQLNGATPSNGPNGLAGFSQQSVEPVGGISGIVTKTWAPLVGVFLGDSPPKNPPPFLDYSKGQRLDQANISPKLGQVFFIGTGGTSSGTPRSYTVPKGGTELYLGVPDCNLTNGRNSQCLVGQYQDNTGTFSVVPTIVEISGQAIPTSTEGGVDTGVSLASGEKFTVHSKGRGGYGVDYPCVLGPGKKSSVPQTDPDGTRYDGAEKCLPRFGSPGMLPTAPLGELIGRIGSGPWFAVGSSYTGASPGAGELFLGYNDSLGAFGDNTGAYSADVFLTPKAPERGHWFLKLNQIDQAVQCRSGGCPSDTLSGVLTNETGAAVPGVDVRLMTLVDRSAGHLPPPRVEGGTTDSTGTVQFSISSPGPQALAYTASVKQPPGDTFASNVASVYFVPTPTALSAVGILQYVGAHGLGACTGSVVNSVSGLVVVTAAHCVTDAQADGAGLWQFAPAYDLTHRWAAFGVWNVTRTFYDASHYGHDERAHDERYDYAFFTLARDSNGAATSRFTGSLGVSFNNHPAASCCTQYSYPSTSGLVVSRPAPASTNYEKTPDSKGAAMYNLSAQNYSDFSGTSSGGPLVGPDSTVEGVLQGPKDPGLFFSGVVGAYLEAPAQSVYQEADNAA